MLSYVYSESPVIRREVLKLEHQVSIPGLPVTQWANFTIPVHWCREASIILSLGHDDTKVLELEEHTDRLGFLSCIEGAQAKISELAQRFALSGSGLYLQVDLRVADVPRIPIDPDGGCQATYLPVPREPVWFLPSEKQGSDHTAFTGYPRIVQCIEPLHRWQTIGDAPELSDEAHATVERLRVDLDAKLNGTLDESAHQSNDCH